MSQYPTPYQTPQPWPQPSQPGTAPPPARRAGILLFILGGLAIVSSLCCGSAGGMLPRVLSQNPELAQQIPPEVTPEFLRLGLLVFAAFAFVYGLALAGL